MKSVKIKIPAKINLTLDVLGVDEKGYHQLSSLVSSISLYDTIVLKKRKDGEIKLKEKGIKSGCLPTENNAVKAAKLFLQNELCGVDIILKKKIPVGGGLGGSSADIAGVLKGLNKLFNAKTDLYGLANALGSDSAYMLNGGLAVLGGRGEKVKKVEGTLKLYLIIIKEKESISAKECYKEFDNQKVLYRPLTENAVQYLTACEYDNFIKSLKNDLTKSAVSFVPKIEENIITLKETGALNALMTGSGSSVYGVFRTKKDRDVAYKKLPALYKKVAIKAETL